MASLWRSLTGSTDVTPRPGNRLAPGQISPLSEKYGGNPRVNGHAESRKPTSRDKISGGDRYASAYVEQSCSCRESVYEQVIENGMQNFYASQNHSRPKLTQADKDDILFCSTEFKQYFGQQDQGVREYAQWLSNAIYKLKSMAQTHVQEINTLRLKLSTAESISEQLESELKRLKSDISQMQSEAMSTVDRFQPTTDGEITDRVRMLGVKVESLSNAVLRSPSRLTDDDWTEAAEELINPVTVVENPPIELEPRTLKGFTLRNAIWHFLTSNIFDEPFGGFEGEEAKLAGRIYKALFRPEGQIFFSLEPLKVETIVHANISAGWTTESESWRSLTATQLQRQSDSSTKAEHLSQLFQKEIVQKLGHDKIDEPLIRKIAAVMALAIDFWRLAAQQRAVFFFKWFDCTTTPLLKRGKDHRYTTVEEGDADVEKSGRICFITRPGLAKRGTGAGKDYDRCIMFDDFKAHVVVDDTSDSPQATTIASQIEAGRLERVMIDGDAGCQSESTAIARISQADKDIPGLPRDEEGGKDVGEPNAEDRVNLGIEKHDYSSSDQQSATAEAVTPDQIAGSRPDLSRNVEVANDMVGPSFKDRVAVDVKSSRGPLPRKLSVTEGSGEQIFDGSGEVLDDMITALPQIPDTASANDVQAVSHGGHSSVEVIAINARGHSDEVARGEVHNGTSTAPENRNVKLQHSRRADH